MCQTPFKLLRTQAVNERVSTHTELHFSGAGKETSSELVNKYRYKVLLDGVKCYNVNRETSYLGV